MTTPRLDTADVISRLLQQEQASVVHFMTTADPYIHRNSGELRRTISTLVKNTLRREAELVNLLAEFGYSPRPVPVQLENQYLAFLSIDYLLPRLVDAKKRSVGDHESAVRLLDGKHEQAAALLQHHLHEHIEELASLDRAAAYASSDQPGPQKPSPAFHPAKNR